MSLFKDRNHVKVTKDNWDRIEDLFNKKEKKIKDQEILIAEQNKIIAVLKETAEELQKYKENDDLLFAYESQVKEDAQKIKKLSSYVSDLEKSVQKADMKIEAVLSLESEYLTRLIQSESKARYCPEYEERGESFLAYYA